MVSITQQQRHYIDRSFPGIRVLDPDDGFGDLLGSIYKIESCLDCDLLYEIQNAVEAASKRLTLLGVEHSIKSKSISDFPIVVATREIFPRVSVITEVPVIEFCQDGSHEFCTFLRRGLSSLSSANKVIFNPCLLHRHGAIALYNVPNHELIVPFSVVLDPTDREYSKRITMHELRHAHAHAAGLSVLTVQHSAGPIDSAKVGYLNTQWTSCESEVQYMHGLPKQNQRTSKSCLMTAQMLSGHTLLILRDIVHGIREQRHPAYKITTSHGEAAYRFLVELAPFDGTDFSGEMSVYCADIKISTNDTVRDLVSCCAFLVERQKNVFEESLKHCGECPERFLTAVNDALDVLYDDLNVIQKWSDSEIFNVGVYENCSKWSYVSAVKRHALLDKQEQKKVIEKTLRVNDSFFVDYVLSLYDEEKFSGLRREIAWQWALRGWQCTKNVLIELLGEKPQFVTEKQQLSLAISYRGIYPECTKLFSKYAEFFGQRQSEYEDFTMLNASRSIQFLCRDTKTSEIPVSDITRVLRTYRSIMEKAGMTDNVANIDEALEKLKH